MIQLGDIGDVVWAVPAFHSLKDACPGARVCVMVREGFGKLLQADPFLDDIFEIVDYKGNCFAKLRKNLGFILMLRKRHFDMVIDLRTGDRGAVIAWLTGAPLRAAADERDASFLRNVLLNRLVRPPARTAKIRGAAEQSLSIIRELGIDPIETIPKLWLTDAAKERAREMIRHDKIDECERWITVNPFSRWRYKEWGCEKWAEILDWLWERYQTASVVVGSREEISRAETLAGKCSGKVFNLAGKTTLDELAGILASSRLHLGVDSAAPHIAAAVGTPTVTIYGPSDWEDWAPIGVKHRVVAPDLDCAPCHQKGCDGKEWSRCLEELKPDQVKETIEEALNQAALQ